MSEGSRNPELFDTDDPSTPADLELERWKRETDARWKRINEYQDEFLRTLRSFDDGFAGTFLDVRGK